MMSVRPVSRISGFSLVELSIVMVVIGLLVGGVLVGQSMIRSAQLRGVVDERARYEGAVQNFRTKYNATPGDMRNATEYFGKNNSACSSSSGTAMNYGTCNGDGNGMVAAASAAGATGEMFQFWVQLARAGMIGGQYTGLAGTAGSMHAIIGTNAPESRLKGAGWATLYLDVTGSTAYFTATYGNAFIVGAQRTDNLPTIAAAFTPEELREIDRKIDDGQPGMGDVMAVLFGTCTSASLATDYAATYKAGTSALACSAIFKNQY